MPKFFNRDIADLTHQLTLLPRRLRMDQISGIELLLELVEEDRSYPFEFVCYHITKYQKRKAGTSALIPGKALIGDLISMAEAISRKANLTVGELPEAYMTHQELADELNVSTKTIRRWRNRGLLGIRAVFEDGVNRLAFLKSTVDRFVIRHQGLVAKGAAFRQLTEAERSHMMELARELLSRRPLKLHAAARLIAEETGRAVETVRYTLRRYEESAEKPLFSGDLQSSLCERFQAVSRCREAGETVESIARAFDSTSEEIEHIIRHVQVVRWKETPLDFMYNELFDAPNADELILEIPEPPPSDVRPTKAPKDTPSYVRSLYRTPLLTPQQEQDLFRRYNYLKHRTAKAIERVDATEIDARDFEELRGSFDRIDTFKQRITRANLRLVVSIAKKHVGWSPNFFEIVSDGNISLMRAIEKFDYSRGVKFSTYASWAIMKNYARSIPEQHYKSARFVTGQDELLDATADRRSITASDGELSQIRQLIGAGLNALTEREREVVTGHFGLGQSGKPLTLEQLGNRFGVTKERVRQIEKRALVRLRESLSPSLVDALPD